MSSNGIELPVTIVPDTESAQKKIKEDLEGKPVKIKVETDEKSFDKGPIEGFLKKFQEFSARIADGGIAKGFTQLGSAAKTFMGSMSDGKGVTTALSDGIHKVGVEGLAVGGGVLAAAAAIVQLTQKMIEATIASAEHAHTISLIHAGYTDGTSGVNALVGAQSTLALQNAAVGIGFRESGASLNLLNAETVRYANATGVAVPQASQLMQQALAGNAGAARQLGVNVSDANSAVEVHNRVLSTMAQRQRELGPATLTAAQQFQQFIDQVKGMGSSIASIGGQLGAAILSPFIRSVTTATNWLSGALHSIDQSLHSAFTSQSVLTTEAAHRNALEQQRLATAQQQEAAHQRALDLLNQENGLLLTQLDRMGAGGNIAGQRVTTEQALMSVYNQLTAIQQRANEGAEEFAHRRIDTETRYQNLVRQNTADHDRVFDQRISEGILQNQLHLAHDSLNIGVAALTPVQAERAIRTELTRLMQQAATFGRELTQDERARVDALAQQALAQRQAAQAQAQAGAQSAQQLRDARFNLAIQTTLAGLHRETVSTSARQIDLAHALAVVEGHIRDFNLSGRNATIQHIEQYTRLTERARTLRETLVQVNAARLDGIPPSQEDVALLDRGLTAVTNQVEARENLNAIGRLDADTLSQSLQLRREALALQVQSLQAAQQSTLEGTQLTGVQRDALSNQATIVEGINASARENTTQLDLVNQQLSSQTNTEENRNRLLQERNELTQRGIELNTQLQQIQEATNGPSFLQQAGQAVRSLGGEYRSTSAVMGSVFSSAMQSMTGALKTHIAAVVAGKETIGQALQGVLNETLMALTQEAIVKALFNTAEGFAALASYRPAEAVQHFTAAGIYAAVAGAAGAGAALTMPSGGESSGGTSSAGASASSGFSSGGTQADQPKESIVINLNGAMYLTQEQVQDAIHAAMKDRARRTGTS